MMTFILTFKKSLIAFILIVSALGSFTVAKENTAETQKCQALLNSAHNAYDTYESLDFQNDDLNNALEVYGYGKIINTITTQIDNNCEIIE